MTPPAADHAEIRAELERVLAHPSFRRAERSSALLRFVVEQTLAGHADRLKEYTLGAEALGRGAAFDPRVDPIVRAEASRLRARLDEYYEDEGQQHTVRLVLAKGSYVPQFRSQTPPAGSHAAGASAPRWPVFRALARDARIAWLCAIAALVAAATTWARGGAPDRRPLEPMQFDVRLTDDGTIAVDVGTQAILTPDGTRVVFVSRGTNGRTRLNTRRLDQNSAAALPGTDGARAPFVSPDGRWIGFWADGALKKTPVEGGEPTVICAAVDLLGASWGKDDSIVAAFGDPGRLWRVSANGGVPQVALSLSEPDVKFARWPQILPDGRHVLYTVSTGANADRAAIEVQSTDGVERNVLVAGGTFGRYLASGYLTYVNQGTLYALPFDAQTLTARGTAVPVLDDVSYSPLFGYAQIDASETGAVLYQRGAESIPSVVEWIDRTGARTPLLSAPGRYGWLRVSPDGGRFAMTVTASGLPATIIYEIKDQRAVRLSSQPGDYTSPTWIPGRDVLLQGSTSGLALSSIGRSADAMAPQRLTHATTVQVPWSVSPDGKVLAYYERDGNTAFDLWTAPLQVDDRGVALGPPAAFLKTPAFEAYPAFSPDGRWLSYTSNESGAWEVYVKRVPDDGTAVRVSASGGTLARWSPNGRELLYRTPGQQVMSVTYRIDGDRFVARAPTPWSRHALANTGVLPNFDIAADGERIVALMPATAAPQDGEHATFVLNFTESLRRKTASP